jgi:hypothetical protein
MHTYTILFHILVQIRVFHIIEWTKLEFILMGESTLRGGHVGHFHDMYVKYISTKCIVFNFEFHF